ncbi:hypothetical protein B0T22DRAFT_458870 [Podospora appendiculata]|uniref:Uncharacterized protein n=1 Tax=Podospora appendiculata TaxID=314037 RepID=A0AAE0X967_9PEZI|nr:hypothetical protein B0T22DRAFT_458870 [Podospora appendiculata]
MHGVATWLCFFSSFSFFVISGSLYLSGYISSSLGSQSASQSGIGIGIGMFAKVGIYGNSGELVIEERERRHGGLIWIISAFSLLLSGFVWGGGFLLLFPSFQPTYQPSLGRYKSGLSRGNFPVKLPVYVNERVVWHLFHICIT